MHALNFSLKGQYWAKKLSSATGTSIVDKCFGQHVA
jgi:hypothetical protein